MRAIILLMLMSSPALSWEFSVDKVCRLDHVESDLAIALTYDPSGPIYSIALTRPQSWRNDPVFGISFNGGVPLTIRTNRHQLSPSGNTLTVSDSGFGNVLNGLSENATATAFLGGDVVSFSLAGAAGPVAAFRECAMPAGTA